MGKSTENNLQDLKYHVVETTDSYGCGGIQLETVSYEGRTASINRICSNEFECEINLINEPLYVFEIRSSRKNARKFVERIIKNDIANNGKNMKYAD